MHAYFMIQDLISNNYIYSWIEHAGFEIDIRIESLKNELDNLGKHLHAELDEFKNEIENRKTESVDYEKEANIYEDALSQLKNDIE